MKRSLFFALYLGIFPAFFILGLYILVFPFSQLSIRRLVRVTGFAESFSAPLIEQITPLLWAENFDEAEKLLTRIGSQSGLRLSLLTIDGEVLADSEPDFASLHEVIAASEVTRASRGSPAAALRYSRQEEQRVLFVAVPITDSGSVIGLLHAGIPAGYVSGLIDRTGMRIRLASGAVLLLSIIGAVVFYLRFMRPVQTMTGVAKRMAAGDFTARAFLKKNEVFKELGDNYNQLAEIVQRYIADVQSQKEELNCVVATMQPGLLVMGRQGRISLYNESAQRILHTDRLVNRYYWEVLREPRLWDTIQTVQGSGRRSKEEVHIDSSYYQVTTAFLPSINETVMLFHDITDIKTLEKIKQDFVMNVSHELRTPLTAIKGYAETIEGLSGDNTTYLEIIKRHTDRLIKIVEDLLILADLEEVSLIPDNEPVDLKSIVEHVVRMFESRTREKELRVELQVQDGFSSIYGDPLKMEQMIINLIDNAVKYTENGEIKISLTRSDSTVMLQVCDTGIGISEKHLNRIFERFYTADKSRSRRLGGTGLGLSIVKHIVQLHSGTIEARSTLGRGTCFTVRLPV
jgi:two-component system phosphate regulon sensor histidine kinase PhoR